MSYGLTASLLKDVLPVGKHCNAATVRNHLCQIAKKQEAELEGGLIFSPEIPENGKNYPNRENQ